MSGMGAWKKLAGLFEAGEPLACGYRIPEAPKVELAVMAETMAGFDDYQWGRYAFSREPLEGRFDEEEKRRYTEEANRCGREWDRDLAERYGEKRPRLLAQKMGLRIHTLDRPTGGGQVLFAQVIRSDEITVFTDCVRRAGALREESGCPLLEPERLMDVLLAHELFHGAEEQNADRIYTRTEKVELWRKPFSNRSTIACLSEMAAMAFAKELLGLSASPYMLDVLLLYAYSREQAWALYDEICVLAGLKENGPGKGRGEGGMQDADN